MMLAFLIVGSIPVPKTTVVHNAVNLHFPVFKALNIEDKIYNRIHLESIHLCLIFLVIEIKTSWFTMIR